MVRRRTMGVIDGKLACAQELVADRIRPDREIDSLQHLPGDVTAPGRAPCEPEQPPACRTLHGQERLGVLTSTSMTL